VNEKQALKAISWKLSKLRLPKYKQVVTALYIQNNEKLTGSQNLRLGGMTHGQRIGHIAALESFRIEVQSNNRW